MSLQQRNKLLIVLPLLWLAGCAREKVKTEVQSTWMQVANRDIEETVEVYSSVESAYVSSVPADTGGKVKKIYVQVDQTVMPGDLVASVENSDVERAYKESAQRVAIAEANLRKREAEIGLEKETGKIQVAEAERDAAKAELEIARLRFDTQKGMFERCTVKAPFEGRVIAIDVKEGQPVIGASGFNNGTRLVTLVSKSEYKVDTSVGEREVQRLKNGESVRLEFPAAPGLTVAGKILTIGATASRAERGAVFPVTVQFESLDPRIRLGGTAKVCITLAKRDQCLSVPVSCVGMDEKGPWVVVQSPDGSARRYVNLGASDGVYVEISSGLSGTDRVRAL